MIDTSTDIDIDVFDRDKVISKARCVRAAMYKDGKLSNHTSGVYFQNIPRDPFTNVSTYDYDTATLE